MLDDQPSTEVGLYTQVQGIIFSIRRLGHYPTSILSRCFQVCNLLCLFDAWFRHWLIEADNIGGTCRNSLIFPQPTSPPNTTSFPQRDASCQHLRDPVLDRQATSMEKDKIVDERSVHPPTTGGLSGSSHRNCCKAARASRRRRDLAMAFLSSFFICFFFSSLFFSLFRGNKHSE